jgi:GrpB-like predicted nucleotidyltransferase (UPF0157 family)
LFGPKERDKKAAQLKPKSRRDVARPPVEVFDYDPLWPRMFDKEKALILSALGNKAICIEHIGSTAVPGLGAKPIIDIMVGIPNLSDAKRCISPLERIGYEYVPEYEDSIPERRYLRKGPNEPNKHYHLHMVEYDGEFWKRQLFFRDYLRTHPEKASEYFKLKKELAVKYRLNREDYTEAKTPFIASIVSKANPEK